MKHLILSIALVFSSLFSFSQDNGITITVTVDNVKNNKGNVAFALHNKETFIKTKGLMEAEVKATENGKVTITFKNVKPGEYAVMAMHDENENKRMDFEDNGMPKESYGMSNNPMFYGPPKFDDAKFKVSNEALDINIRF